jgi:Bax protein
MTTPASKNKARARVGHHWPRPLELLLLVGCGYLLFEFVNLEPVAEAASPPPDFSSMEVGEKKRAFFAYLSPKIAAVNFQMAADRDRVTRLRERFARGRSIGWFDRRWLGRLGAKLEVPVDELPLEDALEALERRAGIVPESIVLVQAALESGWGTSRFAIEGNNFFGQRCYRPDCGMAPTERPEDAQFGLARFPSADASVESYMINLNTHPSYRDFRVLRQTRRAEGQAITGLALVDGLTNYSERGTDYVEEIAAMIRANRLEE